MIITGLWSTSKKGKSTHSARNNQLFDITGKMHHLISSLMIVLVFLSERTYVCLGFSSQSPLLPSLSLTKNTQASFRNTLSRIPVHVVSAISDNDVIRSNSLQDGNNKSPKATETPQSDIDNIETVEELNDAIYSILKNVSTKKKDGRITRDDNSQTDSLSIIESAQELLESNVQITTNIRSYIMIIEAYALHCREPQKAHDLLMSLPSTLKESSIFAFNTVLNGWALVAGSSKYPQASRKAQDLLSYIEQSSNMNPDIVTYNTVLNVLGKSSKYPVGNFSKAKKAEKLLRRMFSEEFKLRYPDIRPNAVSFGAVLAGYARCGGKIRAAQVAEGLLEEMEQIYSSSSSSQLQDHEEEEDEREIKPTTYCVNSVLNAWSQAAAYTYGKQASDAAHRAETILVRMEDLYRKGRIELKPNTISYNTVISAFARSGAYKAAEKAEAILRHMDYLRKSSEIEVNDDDKIMSQKYSFQHIQPDAISFNAVIHAWARSKHKYAPKRAEAILVHMGKLYSSGETNIRPDVTTYSTVINAWARSASTHGKAFEKEGISPAKNAEALLFRMLGDSSPNENNDGYEYNTNPSAKPNLVVFNSVLNAWSKSSDLDGADRAYSLLQDMEQNKYISKGVEVKPDVYSYTCVIDAFAKRKDPKMAEELLNRMEDLYNSTGNINIKPNLKSYTSVINAFSRSGNNVDPTANDPIKAESILHRLENLSHSSGNDEGMKPDTICYNAVINAFGWSTLEDKVQRAYDLFLTMLDLYESGKNVGAKPDIVTCNSLLNACAYPTCSEENMEKTLKIAISIYETFLDNSTKYGRISDVNFGVMILACSNLLPLQPSSSQTSDSDVVTERKRTKLIEAVWWRACKEGKVTPYVFTQFKNALSSQEKVTEILRKFDPSFKDSVKDVDELPLEWTRNNNSRRLTRKE